MVQGAVTTRSMRLRRNTTGRTSEQAIREPASDEAAVATAAYLVLKNIIETVPDNLLPTKATLLASLETQYNASKNAIPDSPFKDQGITAGTAAAQAMIDARQGDGRFGPSQFVANPKPGY